MSFLYQSIRNLVVVFCAVGTAFFFGHLFSIPRAIAIFIGILSGTIVNQSKKISLLHLIIAAAFGVFIGSIAYLLFVYILGGR